jgi:excisionase family DNA binding protein
MDKLLTAREVAEIIGCHEQTIYKWKDQGKIPFIKKNGLIRFRESEIKEWIEQGSNYVDALTESLTQVDLPLAAYDIMFLKGETMSQTGKTWTYPFGSVYLRHNKSSKERWYIYYRIEGKRVRKVVKGAQTRSDALKVLQVEVADAFRGKYGFEKQEKRIKFTAFAELYLTNYAKINKRSWVTDEYMLKKAKAFFKDKDLQEIGSLLVEKFRTSLLENDAKKSTTNRYLALLKTMFNLAIDWGYLKENPDNKVKLFSEKDNLQERILSYEEEKKLLDACPRYLKPIVLTALHTGMRKGEILNLKWEQVDFLNREIKVKNTKSGKPRFIPMNSLLYETLKNEKKLNGKSPLVFPSPRTNKPFVDIKKSFAEAVKNAGIPSLRFHDARHSFASRLVAAGVDLITVKELLGHHSVRITERYTHANTEQKRNAVEGLTLEKKKPPVPILSTKTDERIVNAMVRVN